VLSFPILLTIPSGSAVLTQAPFVAGTVTGTTPVQVTVTQPSQVSVSGFVTVTP
jgi:hypothetical protein